MEGIDWSGEQNGGKWMAAIDGRNMDTRAAIHGRNRDTGREAGKDDGGGHEGGHTRPQRRHEEEASEDDGEGDTRAAKDGRNGDTASLKRPRNGRFNDAETGGRGYWRSLRASRSMSATGWQLSLRSMLWPVSGV